MKVFKEFTILLILMCLMIAGTLCGCSVILPEETTEKTYASGTFHENRPYAEIGSEEYIFKSDGMEASWLLEDLIEKTDSGVLHFKTSDLDGIAYVADNSEKIDWKEPEKIKVYPGDVMITEDGHIAFVYAEGEMTGSYFGYLKNGGDGLQKHHCPEINMRMGVFSE